MRKPMEKRIAWFLVALALALLLGTLLLTWRMRATIPPPSSLDVALNVALMVVLLPLMALPMMLRHRKGLAMVFIVSWALLAFGALAAHSFGVLIILVVGFGLQAVLVWLPGNAGIGREAKPGEPKEDHR
jgi:hypothetical protein